MSGCMHLPRNDETTRCGRPRAALSVVTVARLTEGDGYKMCKQCARGHEDWEIHAVRVNSWRGRITASGNTGTTTAMSVVYEWNGTPPDPQPGGGDD